jgi:hypothetical protein
MPAAPPAAETKKPATPPPDKAQADKGKAGGGAPDKAGSGAAPKAPGAATDKSAGAAKGGDAKGSEAAGGASPKTGAQAGAGAGQQRFDRMAVRTKLAVSEPGDAVEREADAVAAKVMRMPEPTGAKPQAAAPKSGASGSGEIQRKEAPSPADGSRGATDPGAKAAASQAPPATGAKPQAGGKPPDATASAAPKANTGTPPIQRQASAPAPSSQPSANQPGTTQEMTERLGAGTALDPDTRSFFEKRMHADFSGVRIHTDATAAQLAHQLSARAFTYGHHVAFASGAYQPQTEDGKRLIAHELTHVMQQSDGVSRMIMREGGGGTSGSAGSGDFEVTHAKLEVPPIKARHLGAYNALAKASNLKRKGAYDASTRGTKQVQLWTDGVKPDLNKIPVAQRPSTGAGFDLHLNMAGGAAAKVIKAGSQDELERLLKIPTWNKAGGDIQFQVDHMVEYQLGGADALENMELLNQAHNGSVGSSFSHGIKRTVREEIDADPKKDVLKTYTGPKNAAGDPTAEGVMEAMTVVFKEATGRARESGRKEGGSEFWSRAQIEALDHVLPLLGQTAGLDGDATRFALLSPTGNLLIAAFPHGNGATKISDGANQSGGMAGFKMQSLTLVSGYNDQAAGANIGTLEGQFEFGPKVKMPQGKVSVAVSQAKSPGAHSGKIGTPTGEGLPNQVDFTPMSPLLLSDLSLGKSVFGKATLQPSHPALSGINIPATIQDGRLGIFYTLDATTLTGKLNIPGVKIDSAGVTFGYDGTDFSVGGGTEFTIQKFGTGYLNAEANTAGDFSLEGGLHADKRLFDQADMKLWYRKKGGFGGRGTLGITTPGKIKGLKSAHLTAKYEDSVFSATGNVEPDIPGLKSASLAVTYGNDELQITGQLAIDDKVPGVEKANVTVTVKQAEAGWKVAASGDVTPKLPGLDGALLKFSYDDGFVLLEGGFDFKKGPLSGKVTAGVTNASVDDKGVRGSGGSGTDFKVFGTADIDAVFIKDKLFGKLKLRLLPDGSVRVGGGLKTGDFEVFPKYPSDGGEFFKKTFETPQVPIPGLGFSVGPVSVGVTLSASLTAKAHASIGPGKLTGIHVDITEFDPATASFDTLEIGGGGTFQVMADAGFSVSAKLNLNLSALVAELTGSVGAEASVGIPPDKPILEAETDFTYSQAKGLDITSTLKLDISPELKFRLFGEVAAKLNLLVDTITVWSKDWTLAEANYKLPIGIKASGALNYKSQTGKLTPANPADAITVEKPNLDSDAMLGLVKGDSAPPAVKTTDKGGKEVTDTEAQATPPSGDAPVAARREDPTDRSPQTVDENIVDRLGASQPLDLATRGFFEQRLRADLSGVQIHTGREAAKEAERLQARAFTVGKHIAFAPNAYAPDTPDGKELLAHELAHVIQQGGDAEALQRCAATPTATAAAATAPGNCLTVPSGTFAGTTICFDPGARCLSLPTLQLPTLKQRNSTLFPLPLPVRQGPRPTTDQTTLWRNAVQSVAATKLSDLTNAARAAGAVNSTGGTETLLLTLNANPSFLLFGTAEALRPRIEIPIWDRQAHATNFQVDHIREMQLNGDDVHTNYELLEGEANMGAGRAIADEIRETIKGGLEALHTANPTATTVPSPNSWRNVKNTYQVSYRAIAWTLPHDGSANGQRAWSLQNVLDGEHTQMLRPMSAGERSAVGSTAEPAIFPSAQGGTALPSVASPRLNWIPRVDLVSWAAAPGPAGDTLGSLTVDVLKAGTGASRATGVGVSPDYPSQAWTVRRVPGLNAGYVDPANVSMSVRNSLRLPGMSPIEMAEVSLTRAGLVGDGRVLPTVPLIGDADIRIRINGNEAEVYKTFSAEELSVPAPFRIDNCDLTVFYGSSSGLGVRGRTEFGIDRLGTGYLGAAASMEGGFALEGRFDFDRSLFDADANILMSYRRGPDAPDGKLAGSGTVTIGAGKVRGIRRATVQAAFDGDQRSLTGTADLDVPGVESASLGVEFTPEGGTQISGSARFRDRPGIRNGRISTTLTQAGDAWRMAATGHADASFAGITTSLDASYDDGLFMFAADAPFAVGERVTGTVRVGATNGQVDDEGRLVPGSAPAPGSGAGELRPFGNGTVTMRLTDWLQGGVGIKVRTNGDLLISGRIGIPQPITVFDAYPPPDRATRTLFSMPTVSVPLVGLSVGSTVVGVALTINGRVTGHAQVGPGRLTQTEVRVEDFNPAQPDSLHVTGDAEFSVGAEAGVSASLDAGVSLGAAIINATAGINVSAGASLTAEARPHVNLDWRAATGLALHADLDASLTPRLAFDVNGFAEVTANAFVTTFSLWRKDWNLAHREIGSNLALRIHAPVDYFSDGRGVVFDPEQVRFDVPTLNGDTLRQLLNDEGGHETVEHEAPARRGGAEAAGAPA